MKYVVAALGIFVIGEFLLNVAFFFYDRWRYRREIHAPETRRPQ